MTKQKQKSDTQKQELLLTTQTNTNVDEHKKYRVYHKTNLLCTLHFILYQANICKNYSCGRSE